MQYRFLKMALLFVTVLGWLRAEQANALIHEESPYLQQHAHNPVRWMPWGKAAFEKASREHKLIFLSIGYSTCHWCHVMEHESFEDPKVAALLNRYFVPVKVDREEHPQIDRYYQQVHRIMTRRAGGWPLTILLTPDRKPFFAATYIPREEKYAQPGLLDLLQNAAKLWQKEPERIERIGEEVTTLMQKLSERESASDGVEIKEDLSRRFVEALEQHFDREHGGWGTLPKFPRATTLTALIRIYRLTGDKRALEMAEMTLTAMARGGIYDQIEGAFFRYSTDGKWRIPHFEKMLYTNAELLEAYALAAELTGKPLYRRVVAETVAVLERHYRDGSGLFYGASDADSLDPETQKKEEGFYFTFAYDEALEALKEAKIPQAEKALEECGIGEEGNRIDFRSNPYLKEGAECPAAVRNVLAKLRAKRPYPFIDKKLQASWNALLIHGLFVASDLKPEYGKRALGTLGALKRELYKEGRLYHQKLPGRSPRVPGLMEDYSFTIAAALDAFEWSQDPAWLHWAEALYTEAKKEFHERGAWYDARGSFRNPLSLEGGAYRSPLGVMADSLLRLSVLTEDLKYRQDAREILKRQSRVLAAYPQAAPMGVLAWLADRYGYVVLKIPKKRLHPLRHEILHRTPYPFLLFKAVKESLYQACRVDRCFLYDRDEKRFLEKLARSLKVKN
jgi:uncharacterized protein YyaL (SSP411 family)